MGRPAGDVDGGGLMQDVRNVAVAQTPALPSPVPGLDVIRPRPEAAGQPAAPGIRISPQLDLILFSGITPYPADVDPWNPGEFRLPSEPAAQGALTVDGLDRLLTAAGATWQHIVSNTSYVAPGGDDRALRARMRPWSCGTSVRVAEVGIPGVSALNEIVAAAPHTPLAARGYVPGIEPVLPRPGILLKDLPQAPAIRITSSVHSRLLSRRHRLSARHHPWSAGAIMPPADVASQERLIEQNIELLLRMAGVTWRQVVQLKVTGEAASLRTLRARFGDWRPCRTTRVVGTGIPGAKLVCELTAVALTEERVD